MKRVIRLVLVNVGILLLGLAVVELVFGNWLKPSDRMNRLRIPRNERIVFDIGAIYPTARPEVVYTRDGFGFRGAYASVSDIDILTLGGSTTDQRWISDGETWQDVIASEFGADGRTVTVVNAGVDGQSTYGHIKDFEWWFPRVPGLKVRCYLFYVGINDFYTEAQVRYDRLLKSRSWRDLLAERSALYDLFRTRRGMREARIYRMNHGASGLAQCPLTDQGVIMNHAALMDGRIKAYRDRLRVLAEKVREAGGTAVFATQPTRRAKVVDGKVMGDASLTPYDGTAINGVDHYHMMRILNSVTLETAHELGCAGFDPAGEVDWEDGDFYDFFHNTPQGAQKLGRYLHAKLQDASLP